MSRERHDYVELALDILHYIKAKGKGEASIDEIRTREYIDPLATNAAINHLINKQYVKLVGRKLIHTPREH